MLPQHFVFIYRVLIAIFSDFFREMENKGIDGKTMTVLKKNKLGHRSALRLATEKQLSNLNISDGQRNLLMDYVEGLQAGKSFVRIKMFADLDLKFLRILYLYMISYESYEIKTKQQS